MFHQLLVHEGAALVTYLERAGIDGPMIVGTEVVLEPDSPIVWFTFPGRWHDIGRFHTPDGRFTGYYANVLTPVERVGDEWRTTDLFLDVLLVPGRPPRLLDRDQLDAALEAGTIDPATARTAEAEAASVMAAARAGRWPPAIVHEWPLERARAAAATAG